MSNLTFEELPKATQKLLQEVEFIKKELQNLSLNYLPTEAVELLTRNETAKFLKISLSTLWNWTRLKHLKSYGIGNKVYYKKHEILEALIKLS